MRIDPGNLRAISARIVRAGGSSEAEAAAVADHLVAANLAGHDSHGVGMLPAYCRDLAAGWLKPNQPHEVISEAGPFAVWDAQAGYGQVVARAAMEWAIGAARQHGVAVHALRNAHHIGRVGTYGEIVAASGFVGLHFVNVSSGDPQVVAFRGRQGRFGTNPVCIAIPGAARTPAIILDMATSRIALGKVRVAYNEGHDVIPGALIDARGTPTTDPSVMYTEPRGAALPFGEHKGSGLALMCELLAGAVGGASTIQPGNPRGRGIINGMLSIVLDPTRLTDRAYVAAEIEALIEWVKSSAPADPSLPVLVAGEPERIARAAREKDGIEIDAATWAQIKEAAAGLGLNSELFDAYS